MQEPPDAALVRDWLTARSIARGLPLPVEDHGGWRVDTGLPAERRRYVFAGAGEGLRLIARSAAEPGVVLKLCGTTTAMSAAVAAPWKVTAGGWFMTLSGAADAAPSPPPGYRSETCIRGGVIEAAILAEDGAVAARGYAARANGLFVYDRIATEPAHRRRGLGAAVMAALAAADARPKARRALVATEAGRALYETLGWTVRSPWTTAQIETTG